MKRAKPWVTGGERLHVGGFGLPVGVGGRPGEVIPSDATTVELSEQEVLQALCAYAGNKLGQNFKAEAILQVQQRGDRLIYRLSFWRPS